MQGADTKSVEVSIRLGSQKAKVLKQHVVAEPQCSLGFSCPVTCVSVPETQWQLSPEKIQIPQTSQIRASLVSPVLFKISPHLSIFVSFGHVLPSMLCTYSTRLPAPPYTFLVFTSLPFLLTVKPPFAVISRFCILILCFRVISSTISISFHPDGSLLVEFRPSCFSAFTLVRALLHLQLCLILFLPVLPTSWVFCLDCSHSKVLPGKGLMYF